MDEISPLLFIIFYSVCFFRPLDVVTTKFSSLKNDTNLDLDSTKKTTVHSVPFVSLQTLMNMQTVWTF